MIFLAPVNIIAILIAGVVNMAIGFVWYSKALFGKPWMKELGRTEAQIKESSKKMGPFYGVMAVASFVMAFVLANVLYFFNADTVMAAVQTSFWIWLGFVATIGLNMVIFEGKSFRYYGITVGYYLVALIAMGVVLTLI